MTAGHGYTIRPLTDSDVDQARALMYRSVVEDFGSEHDPRIHADVDDLLGSYGTSDGPFMLVAHDDTTGKVIATGGIRSGALTDGLSPEHLVERYGVGRTGQIVRLYVLREERRRGIARAMVRAILDRAAAEGHYDRIVFHAFQHSPGAVAFWTSMGARLVEDDTDGVSNAIFFELFADTCDSDKAHRETASAERQVERQAKRQGSPL